MYNIFQRFGMALNQIIPSKRTKNSAFLRFPVEIILLICEMVEHTPTLKSLSLVCILCNDAATRVLFQIIRFRRLYQSNKSNAFKQEMKAFERRPYLRLVVQEVRICALSINHRELYPNFVAVLEKASVIESFVNLQSIVFLDMSYTQWANQELAAYLCVLPKLHRLKNVEFHSKGTIWGFYDPQSNNALSKLIKRNHPDIFTEVKSLGVPCVPLNSNAFRTVYPSLQGVSIGSCLNRIPFSDTLRRLHISHVGYNEESLLVTLRGILALPLLEVMGLKMHSNAYLYLARCVEVVQFEVIRERSTLKELYLDSDSTKSSYSAWKSTSSIDSVVSLLNFAIGVSSLQKIEIREISQNPDKAIPLITRTSRKTIQGISLPSMALSSDSFYKILSECSVLSELSCRLTYKSEKCLHEALQSTNSLRLLEFVVPNEFESIPDEPITEILFSQICKSLKEIRKRVGYWIITIWTVNWVKVEENDGYIRVIDQRMETYPKPY